MKKFIVLLLSTFCYAAVAETIDIKFMNEDNTLYANSTCNVNGDLIIPSTQPTKRGYTFVGWKLLDIKPVEYIDINTSILDTGYMPDENVSIRINITPLNLTGNAIISLSSMAVSSHSTRLFNNLGKIYFDWNGVRRIGNNDSFEPDTNYDFLIGSRYVKDWDTKAIIVGDEQKEPIDNPVTIKLGDNVARAKIYKFQIYDNDAIVRDFFPVLDENEIPALYDAIEGKFYYPESGNFIAGPVINSAL
jgi:uncharacterized repeat protein (TIGR02543 family)